MAAPPPGARCAKHASGAAVDLCQRCGSFVCSDCIEIRNEEVYCQSCAAILDRPPSRRIRAVFWISLLWLPLLAALFIFGAVTRIGTPAGIGVLLTPVEAALMGGLWLAERIAMKRGEAPARGQLMMRVSLGCVLLSSLVSVGAVVFFVFAIRAGGA